MTKLASQARRLPNIGNTLSAFTQDFVLGGAAGRRQFISQVQDFVSTRLIRRDTPSPDLLAAAAERLPPVAVVPTPRRPPGMGRPRRVAYLTNQLLDLDDQRPRYGGGERICHTIASLLNENGCEVTIYQRGSKDFKASYHGLPVIGITANECYNEFYYQLSDRFFDLSLEYDHVIYNLPEYASGARMRADALLICHGIWFDHRLMPTCRTETWFAHLYRAFSSPGTVVSVDTNSINVIRALWPELAPRMRYIPNFADCSLFHPPIKRSGTELTVVFPRRSHPNRGSRLLADILKAVPHRCRFVWVGEGDAEDTKLIKALAEQDPRLQYASAEFDEMPGYYRAADICVIPTLASEGTSLSCIEGMASGCAMVVTNVGGLPDIIQPELNGLMVTPTAPAIAAAINQLLTHHDERARLQAAARASAERFDVTRWKRSYLALFRELGWIPLPDAEHPAAAA